MKLPILLAALAGSLWAAEPDHNGILWLTYSGDHRIANSRWSAHFDASHRRAGFAATPQFVILRPAVLYDFNAHWGVGGGYSFSTTHPYGAYPAPGNGSEHRTHQQLVYKRNYGRVFISNRFRMEQRFLSQQSRQSDGAYRANGYRFQSRARYQIRAEIPLHPGAHHYWALADEVMFNFGKNVDRNVYGQNRIYGGVGHVLNEDASYELGYMETDLRRPGGVLRERLHSLILTFNWDRAIFMH